MKRNKQPFVGRWALRRGEEKNICAGIAEGLESGRVADVDWFDPTRVEPLTFHWRVEEEGGTGKVCRRGVGRGSASRKDPEGKVYFSIIFFVARGRSKAGNRRQGWGIASDHKIQQQWAEAIMGGGSGTL